MKIIITERQYKLLSENTQLDLSNNEVEDICGKEIDYIKFGYQWDMVYINLPDNSPNDREMLFSKINSSDCDIILHNIITNEKFVINSKDIKITNTTNKKLYIKKLVYDNKILPYFPPVKQFEEIIEKSSSIKESLKRAFKDNWVGKNEKYVAGVVNIFPIDKTPNRWSIVNFFNTKKTIKDRIKLYLVRDYYNGNFIPNDDIKESVIKWMCSLFADVNGKDMLDLVEIQKKSIMTNYKLEFEYCKKIQKKYHPNKKFQISGFGTIKDIKYGIDATIGGFTYQIKPLSKIEYKKHKDNSVSIFVSVGESNANTYSDKYVNRMAFANNNDLYVFNTNILSLKGNTYEFNINDLIKPVN